MIARAQKILNQLEASDRQAPTRKLVDDLPLFAVAARAPEPEPLATDALRDQLDGLDPDEMTPRAALEALYALKKTRNREKKAEIRSRG